MKLLKKIRSIQFILAFWYSLLLLLGFSLFGASVYVYLQHLLEVRLDQNLTEEVEWISEIVELEHAHMTKHQSLDSLSEDIENSIAEHFSLTPRNYIVVLTTTKGNVLYESDERGEKVLSSVAIDTAEKAIHILHLPSGGNLRVAGKRVGSYIIHVAYTEEATRTVLRNLISIFNVLAPVVLFLAFSSGWLMAGIILRPIGQISTMANRISAQNLSERIPVRDVDDELGRLISTMNRMISRLEASFEEMKQFSMNVAHELRTPLTIMKGESELALSKPLSREETQDLITTYLEETSRMSRIIDDLLMLAKADAGQMTIQREQVHIDSLIRDLYEDALILAAPKEIVVRLVHVEPAEVEGDPVRLRQLFRILVANAVQYTDPCGAIAFTCGPVNAQVQVTIEDNGIGIPPESLDKIFQRFYRVDQARTRVKGGSGLGLSIAKWIVESHKGEISVSSEPGKGSRFTVRLPQRMQ